MLFKNNTAVYYMLLTLSVLTILGYGLVISSLTITLATHSQANGVLVTVGCALAITATVLNTLVAGAIILNNSVKRFRNWAFILLVIATTGFLLASATLVSPDSLKDSYEQTN
jgi:hypothetical protein